MKISGKGDIMRVNILRKVIFAAFLLLTGSAAYAGYDCRGRVIRIADGDTITMLCEGKSVKVRIFGVDSPERAQPYGMDAREFTYGQVYGEYVELEIKDKDKYGRTVGIIRYGDGKVLNEELLKAGFGWHYKKYSDDAEYARMEIEARENHRGLWQDPDPMAPWDYRHQQRNYGPSESRVNYAAALWQTAASLIK